MNVITNRKKNIEPVTWDQMPIEWQMFHQLCLEIGFGELRNCSVENDSIVQIEVILQTHNPISRASFISATNQLVHESFLYLQDLCKTQNGHQIPLIKLNACLPVLIETIKKGGWRLLKSG